MNAAQALQAVLVIAGGLVVLALGRAACRVLFPPRPKPGALAKTVDRMPERDPHEEWPGAGGAA